MPAPLPAQSTALVDHTHARAQPGSVDAGAFAAGVYGATVSDVRPTDPADPGVAVTVSRSDHQHDIPAGVPSALTKTAASAEGTSTNVARRTHVHATDALPWGIVDRDIFTSASAAFATGATTDFSLTVTADVARLYEIVLSSQVDASVDSRWVVEVYAAGTQIGELYREQILTGGVIGYCGSSVLWLPASGSITVDVRVLNTAGGGTLTFPGSATVPRAFWIKDIGPR